jgi:hypothetical protein
VEGKAAGVRAVEGVTAEAAKVEEGREVARVGAKGEAAKVAVAKVAVRVAVRAGARAAGMAAVATAEGVREVGVRAAAVATVELVAANLAMEVAMGGGATVAARAARAAEAAEAEAAVAVAKVAVRAAATRVEERAGRLSHRGQRRAGPRGRAEAAQWRVRRAQSCRTS